MYSLEDSPKRRLRGHLERIGLAGTRLTIDDPAGPRPEPGNIGQLDHPSAARFLIDWLDDQVGFASISAVG